MQVGQAPHPPVWNGIHYSRQQRPSMPAARTFLSELPAPLVLIFVGQGALWIAAFF
jgi:hypothetical protein